MKNTSLIILVLLIIISISIPVNAQWITSGLADKYILCMTSSGSNLFAGLDGEGVFRSTDNGANWTEVNTGLNDLYINVLTVNSSGHIIAGTFDGVFISTNNGTNWTEISNGLTETDVNALIAVGSTLYAGAHAVVGGLVFRSTDNGANWTEVGKPSDASFYLKSFAVIGSTLFAGTTDGVYYTTDNGANWTAANTGLSDTYVYSLAVIGATLFASTQSFVFRSTNNGGNWTALSTEINEYTYSLAVNNSTLFAGTNGDVYISNNNGADWTKATTGMTNPRVTALKVFGTHLYAGTNNGTWRRPLSEMTTPVKQSTWNVPTQLVLEQNYPNPFNPSTTIRYSIPAAGRVTLKIYSMLGQLVTELVNEEQSMGWHEVQWDATVASGLYCYRIETSNAQNPAQKLTQVRAMILTK